MKTYSDAAMEAIARGEAIVEGAAEILCDPPVRVWGGPGTRELDGENYVGLDGRGFAQRSGGAIGGAAQGIELVLSGLDPKVIELLDADEVRNAPVVIRRLIFAGDGRTLLDHHVFDRGRIDQVGTDETIGGEAAIRVMVEGAARGLGRRGARMRSDADQRLVRSDDGHFRHTAFAGQKLLYWGGRRPARAGAALGGGGGGGGGGGNVTEIFWNNGTITGAR